jgi:hypothetical protein
MQSVTVIDHCEGGTNPSSRDVIEFTPGNTLDYIATQFNHISLMIIWVIIDEITEF